MQSVHGVSCRITAESFVSSWCLWFVLPLSWRKKKFADISTALLHLHYSATGTLTWHWLFNPLPNCGSNRLHSFKTDRVLLTEIVYCNIIVGFFYKFVCVKNKRRRFIRLLLKFVFRTVLQWPTVERQILSLFSRSLQHIYFTCLRTL